jgi:hypothetical protein
MRAKIAPTAAQATPIPAIAAVDSPFDVAWALSLLAELSLLNVVADREVELVEVRKTSRSWELEDDLLVVEATEMYIVVGKVVSGKVNVVVRGKGVGTLGPAGISTVVTNVMTVEI